MNHIWDYKLGKMDQMEEFANSVVRFLDFNEYKILEGKGKVSKIQAEKKALEEYREYNKTQPIKSDFDEQIKELQDLSKRNNK